MSSLQIVNLGVAVVILLAAVEMLRRRQLREKYAILWLLVGLGALALGVLPSLLDDVAGLLGIADPPNLLSFGAVVFLLGVTAHLSWEASNLEDETRTLAEEVAMLRQDLQELREEAEGRPDRY